MPTTKSFRRNTKHIRIAIRPPTYKELDMNDDFDVQEAKKRIFREWKQIEDEVLDFFNIIDITEKNSKVSKEPLELL